MSVKRFGGEFVSYTDYQNLEAKFVSYTDYQNLEAQLATLKEENERLKLQLDKQLELSRVLADGNNRIIDDLLRAIGFQTMAENQAEGYEW